MYMSLAKIFKNTDLWLHPIPPESEPPGVAARNLYRFKVSQVTLRISRVQEPLVYKSQFVL